LRGGSWNYEPAYCRVAYRYNGTPTIRFSILGFRLVFP
jgi:formylglycine-generating enzyme required for sulfatase activity